MKSPYIPVKYQNLYASLKYSIFIYQLEMKDCMLVEYSNLIQCIISIEYSKLCIQECVIMHPHTHLYMYHAYSLKLLLPFLCVGSY